MKALTEQRTRMENRAEICEAEVVADACVFARDVAGRLPWRPDSGATGRTTTLAIYAHAVPATDRRAAQVMGDLLDGPVEPARPDLGPETMSQPARRRWRFYETVAGRRPVRDFLDGLSGDDLAVVAAALRDVARNGLVVARQVRGDIYEVREDGDRQTFRILFAVEGRGGHVLLALEGFSKKTRKTPPASIELAERRLADWRSRARPHR